MEKKKKKKKDLSKDLVSKCPQSLPRPIKPVRHNKGNVAFPYSLRNFSAAFDTVDHNTLLKRLQTGLASLAQYFF